METKNKRNLVIWAIIVLVLLNISSLGTIWYHRYQFKKARQTERPDRRFDGRRSAENRGMRQIPPFMLRGMDLSTEQRASLDSTWHYFNSKRRVLEDSMNENRRRLFDLMMNETLDTGQYEELSAEQVGIMRELNNTMLNMNRAMRTNLTEEQKKALSDNMQRIKNRRPNERRQRVRK